MGFERVIGDSMTVGDRCDATAHAVLHHAVLHITVIRSVINSSSASVYFKADAQANDGRIIKRRQSRPCSL